MGPIGIFSESVRLTLLLKGNSTRSNSKATICQQFKVWLKQIMHKNVDSQQKSEDKNEPS